MRVVMKMTLALTGAGLIVFGTYGAYLLRGERHDLVRAVEREVLLLGRSLRVSAEHALRDQQVADIRDALGALEFVDETLEVRVYTPDGDAIAATHRDGDGDSVPPDLIREAIRERRSTLSAYPPEDPRRMLLAMPLIAEGGGLLGGLLMIRPLDDLRTDLAATRRSVIVSVAAFICASAILGLLLGTVYIGRPLARSVAAMRRVRSGDLHSVVPVLRNDELGLLAQEFNGMVAELRLARARLDQETESRRRLQRHLQEADKLITIGQLSAGLAHEIGSPLQVINGRARQLIDHPADAEETHRLAEILVEQTNRITRIVDQLLRFARSRPAHRTEIDLPAAVRGVFDLLAHEARRRGVRLTVHSDPGLRPILADPDQIQQVALNLVTNALNATSAGGEIGITIGPTQLGSPPRDGVRLVVEDTGSGIAASDRDHLFEPFFTTRSHEGGTGLGLAVVKAIVTEHGGEIQVAPGASGGSRFTVDLPLSDRQRTGAGCAP